MIGEENIREKSFFRTLYAMKMIQKIHLLVCLSLALVVNSCDYLATEEYYTYTKNDGYNESYILWNDSSRCGAIICDTTIKFDGLKLLFPSDNSTIKGYYETYYKPVRNEKSEKREIVDSVKNYAWYFDVNESDNRIEENSFTILYFLNDNTIVVVDTLYRKKEQITIIDRLPLPKLH